MLGGKLEPEKYDFVIGNPPYMKIPKDAPEATAMPEVCYGAPNLYFIFAAMGLDKFSGIVYNSAIKRAVSLLVKN